MSTNKLKQSKNSKNLEQSKLNDKKLVEEKTVQINFFKDSSVSVDYYLGDKKVGETVNFESVPKRLRFFLEKFPV
jgi:hypothetical protein